MVPPPASGEGRARRRFLVQGVVQGVGFRPFVYATASELMLAGSVTNSSAGVVVEVEGAPFALEAFQQRLREQPPPLAVVERVTAVDVAPRGGTGFSIGPSTTDRAGRTLASPDVATCADCLRELADPADRRHRHPFITCTNCGPRFTIIESLPYDRAATTMARFPLCGSCAREYADPRNRRFHAQPIACHDCGPTLELVDAAGGRTTREEALAGARALLAAGGVLAVKGLGGYHLACDASSETAVATLRARKRRGAKPFAVMVGDVQTARRLTVLDPGSEALLTGPRRPVVLLPRRGAPLAPSVAPGNPDLGVLLAYTPLHTLLLGLPGDPAGPEVLVMTSGNLGGEPIAYRDDDALERLAPLADGWLRHDRPILVPCDDSVVRVVDGEELPVRRSRGYAPLPVALRDEVPATLAVGADLKNTCAVAEGRYAWLSQHVGDMDDLATLRAFDATVAHLSALTQVEPTVLAVDAHPGYRSSAWARGRAGTRTLRTVQHHHAHIAAVMAEHGLPGDAPVIGVAFDGTGYGTDGAVWGGEVLLADYKGFTRAAHLSYVPLAGGDASVRRPYRMALAHLRAADVAWASDLPPVMACPDTERRVLLHQLDTGLGCAPTSSMGRLFDAVSSLAGVRHVADYEAQAAIELEGVSRGQDNCGAYSFGVRGEGPAVADAAPVVRAVVADLRSGVPAAVIGARFHAGVATLVVDLAATCRTATGIGTIALSGGVFANALLLSMTRRRLRDNGFTVLCHRHVPPNDGGLALGQVLVASAG